MGKGKGLHVQPRQRRSVLRQFGANNAAARFGQHVVAPGGKCLDQGGFATTRTAGQDDQRVRVHRLSTRYRTFSVASPSMARISEMIQNRITICGSAQPRFSKWWWIGAIRKMRFLVRL